MPISANPDLVFLLPSPPPDNPIAEIIVLSCSNNLLATVHPLFKPPTKSLTGAFASSKKVSQKGDFPLINVIGLVVTPG